MGDKMAGHLAQGIVTEAAKGVVALAAKGVEATMNIECNFLKFLTESNLLEARMQDFEEEMELERRKNKKPKSRSTVWCQEVKKTVKRTRSLEARYKSLAAWEYPGFANEVSKMLELVQLLKSEAPTMGDLMIDKTADRGVKENAPDIKQYPTLLASLEEALNSVEKGHVHKVAIFGTLGVGKSTVLKNLNNHYLDYPEIFDAVIFMTMTKTTTEDEIRRNIAARLEVPAEALKEFLQDMKCLLVLDNVERSLDLSEIGVPDNNAGSKVVIATKALDVAYGMGVDKKVDVKILQTDGEAWDMFKSIARDTADSAHIKSTAIRVAQECGRLPFLIQKVASFFNLKGCKDQWEVGLDELRKKQEKEVSGFKEEIHNFVKLCYGDLKTDQHKNCFLYTALFPSDTKIYVDYLVESWAAEGFLGHGDAKGTFRKLKANGKNIVGNLTDCSLLESENKRLTYIKINYLIRDVALHIISSNGRVYFTLKWPYAEGILSNIPWGTAEKIAIINCPSLSSLPDSLNCGKLSSLLLQKNSGLTSIHDLFFQAMKGLLVLDLHETGMRSLPPSLEEATGLKVLYLNGCSDLQELPREPPITKLPLLKVLDARDCGKMPFLFEYVNTWKHLACMRISFYRTGEPDVHSACPSMHMLSEDSACPSTSNSNAIQPVQLAQDSACPSTRNHNAIQPAQLVENSACPSTSNHNAIQPVQLVADSACPSTSNSNAIQPVQLDEDSACPSQPVQLVEDSACPSTRKHDSALEELTIEVRSCQNDWGQEVNAVIELANTFKYLRTLRIGFLPPSILQSEGAHRKRLWSQLDSFWLFISCKSSKDPLFLQHFDYEVERYVRYEDDTPVKAHSLCLQKTQALELIGNNMIRSLSDFTLLNNLKYLLGCQMANCGEVTAFVVGGIALLADILPKLQLLKLKNLRKLSSIVQESVPDGSLVQLQTVEVISCPMLTNILSDRLASKLSNFKKLVIERCTGISEVRLPHSLEELELIDLPLTKISACGSETTFPNLKLLKILRCDSLTTIPFTKANAPKLRRIKAKRGWWEALVWQPTETKQHLQSICILG